MRYAVVIEKADGNYSGYVPDLPGCVATGATPEEVQREIKEGDSVSSRRLASGWRANPSTICSLRVRGGVMGRGGRARGVRARCICGGRADHWQRAARCYLLAASLLPDICDAHCPADFTNTMNALADA
jgi:hypothetical protein